MEHFSRGQPIACGPINLYQPIHQAMETARARQFPGVRFAEDFDPSLPLVHGNHDAMVQILLNLLTNGCEALGGRDDGVVRLPTAYRHGLSIDNRSEEPTSELQSLKRISYAVFCCKQKNR